MVSDYQDAGQAAWAQSAGIEVIRGAGRLDGPGRVSVGDETYLAADVVIATGSDAAIPPVPGLRDLPGVWTNREATGLRQVPRRLLVLGAGPVGVELGQAVARMGGEVAIVEGMDRLLAREPAPLGDALAVALRADGVELHLGVTPPPRRATATTTCSSSPTAPSCAATALLVATGRRPRVDGLGLETVGVEAGRAGIAVDARMNAGDGLWAIGDVTGIWPLTYVGKYQGRVAAANILGEAREADYSAVPRVVFTDPQVAAVGDADGPSWRPCR